ncbi:hypothetical protein [Hyphomonas sp.]|uniref:hypothetical protein n=1 Tax=Hyphomonas sp. TaxID=87 RepID=UPI0030018913
MKRCKNAQGQEQAGKNGQDHRRLPSHQFQVILTEKAEGSFYIRPAKTKKPPGFPGGFVGMYWTVTSWPITSQHRP